MQEVLKDFERSSERTWIKPWENMEKCCRKLGEYLKKAGKTLDQSWEKYSWEMEEALNDHLKRTKDAWNKISHLREVWV